MDIKEVITEVTGTIQDKANVKAVFGEPYEKDNLTVIPVARVSISGGGCTGSNEKETDENPKKKPQGMGLHIKNVPVGYIEVSNDEARFVEISDPSGIIKLGIALGAFTIFSLTRILIKLLKR